MPRLPGVGEREAERRAARPIPGAGGEEEADIPGAGGEEEADSRRAAESAKRAWRGCALGLGLESSSEPRAESGDRPSSGSTIGPHLVVIYLLLLTQTNNY